VYRAFFAGFPDLRLTVDETVEEGERIAVRFTVRGTHEGVFQGIPPTGRPVEVQGFSILHFSAGRIVERWNQLDQLSMLQQLGVLPAPGAA
jgi:predicted ester cyclase